MQFVGTHEEALENSSFYAGLWASENLMKIISFS